MTGDLVGNHAVYLAENRLESRDVDTGWTYFYADSETTNTCDRGANPQAEIVGDWWYEGGVDDEGSAYDLADLPYLEYVRLDFNADGTYDTEYKYCRGLVNTGGGTWTFNPATGQFDATGDVIGNHVIWHRNGRVETADTQTGWQYFYAASETRNDCGD
jgi:hypothetical protein